MQSTPPLPEPVAERLERLDGGMLRFMRRFGTHALRLSLGVVFTWFGILKVLGESPVEGIVTAAVPWLAAGTALMVLGAWEILVGVLLFFGRLPRVALALLWTLLAGTFVVLLARPDIAFQGRNPALLTMEGEFIVKNLVLVAAGLVVGGRLEPLAKKWHAKERKEEGERRNEEGRRPAPTAAVQAP